uniref:Putative ovule protein n=1 Tax=Solanum chacoense TaxID=4108 RepID=A0A0V0H121_SOLCH
MKHVELDYHFIREKVIWGAMVTKFVPLHQHIANIFLSNHCPNISVSNFEPSWVLLLIPPPA